MTKTILLVEDEMMLGQTLAAYLRKDDFTVEHIVDGAEVLAAFNRCQPVMVLLDLMLPNVDGITLCNQIRQRSQVPIIMLTARVDELDRLLGLEIGADDYVCKPYSPREVVARVKAVLRRYNNDLLASPIVADSIMATSTSPTNLPHNTDSVAITSPLVIDEAAMDASWNGVSLGLTVVEFRLLHTMAKEPRRVFSRDQLITRIYNDHRIVSDRTIDSHITKLRRKLNGLNSEQDVIRSVYGAGYKFEQPLPPQ